MAFLEIEGITINALVGAAAEDPPEVMGRLRRAFAGNMISTQRSPKLNYRVRADFFSAAELDVFLRAISKTQSVPFPGGGFGTIPKPVTVSSADDGLTRGATISCYVIAGEREPNVQTVNGVETTWWTVPLQIRQA